MPKEEPPRAPEPAPSPRRGREALHQSEELFRLLVDSVREYAIFMLDPGGRVATWNPGAERLKGYRASDIIGEHFSRFYPPDVPRDVIDAELDIALRDGQFRDEGWRLRKDGSRFWADVSITPVRDSDGVLRGFAKVTRDMTSHRLAEEQRTALIREQAARTAAERASRVKDEFLATLSHELRTPLNAIMGWAHLLEEGALDADTSAKAITVIRRNAEAQTQLIADILDLSRISVGKVHLRVQRVDLHAVVQAAMDAVAPAASAKGVQVTRLLSTDVGPVSGDPHRLQQVVWNLLTNAVKFTPRGGRVEVRLQRVDSRIQIAVQDTGAGIDPEFLAHVFEPFRQADATPTRVHGGLGLGLAIVRHLVELHGGTVRAESAGYGQGATFIVEMPLMPLTEAAPAPGTPAPPALHGLSVLLVEDDEDSRALILAALTRLGATVHLAASAAEGLKLLKQVRPDVLVSDINMPHESGYDLMQQVRALPVYAGGLVPAIALTAYARPEDRMRALSAGFEVHISKPVHLEELAAAIANLTARTRRLP